MRLQVNVNDDVVKEIDKYANAFGMTRSSLCSYFIGQGIFGIKKGIELGEEVCEKVLDEKK